MDQLSLLEKPQEKQYCPSHSAQIPEPLNHKPVPPPPEDKITKIVRQDDMKNLPSGSVEIATIAVTEDDVSDILDPNLQKIPDDELPDVLLKVAPSNDYKMPEATPEKCAGIEVNWKTFTSTWLSVSAKNINFADFLPATVHQEEEFSEPVCKETQVSLR